MPLPDALVIVADSYWRARTALRQAAPDWSPSEHVDLDSAALERLYAKELAGERFSVARKEGDAPLALARAERAGRALVRAHYVSAWQAHAPLEPMNCSAEVQGTTCTLWAPTQGQQMCQLKVGAALGISPTDVTVNRTLLGGGFGRRLVADYAIYAALAAKACGRPVKLIWSREEDMAHELFRPRVENQLTALLGKDGLPAALQHRIVSPTILSAVMGNGHVFRYPEVDPSCIEGLSEESPYGLGELSVELHVLEVPVPTMVWRGTGFSPNLFALESFVDELALVAGDDPLHYRRRLVERRGANPRALAVLDRLAHESSFGRVPAGTFQGAAFGHAFETYFGQVVDITLDGKDVRVEQVTTVIDAGLTVDPEIARASIQSGIVWGLTQSLCSEIRFAKGRALQRNFDGFRLLTLPETPKSKTVFIESGKPPGGMGELGPLGIPAALANAIAAATGVRHRELPLARGDVLTPYQRQFAAASRVRSQGETT
jgi:isoquinoline 1-oxidoreductase beta subunit